MAPAATTASSGGADNDSLDGGEGDDTLDGGIRAATSSRRRRRRRRDLRGPHATPVAVTLDGVANDGEADELDNVGADVENLIGGSPQRRR